MALSKNVTIQEIAQKANVSIATTSRVIKQPGVVRAETRDKVLRAWKELHYQAKGNESRMLLASFPDFSNPFYGECIRGMQIGAERRGYRLFLQQMEGYSKPDDFHFLMNNQVFSGLIFTLMLPDQETLDSLRMKYPIVMCSQYDDRMDVPFVAIDDVAAARSAMSYLFSIGKRRIALFNAGLEQSYAILREQGYRDALREAGLPVREEWIVRIPEIDFNVAFTTATALLAASDPPDAVFCVSDVFASAVVKAANALGRAVPSQLAVMGFDNINLTTMTVPTLSSISQPAYQIGWLSCNLLIDQIEENHNNSDLIMLDTEVIGRAST